MKIEIIIPNYNGLDLIKRNLAHVIEAIKLQKNPEITIVDDGSGKEEQELLEDFIEKVRLKSKVKINLLTFEKNLGFSSNVNRAAMRSSSDLIVLLNTDVAPHKDFLNFLIPHFEDESMFGVGCMDESIEKKTVLRGRGLAFWKKGMLIHKKGEINKTDTFWVSGGSSMYKTKLLQKLGGFDVLYDPFYWEDIDISYRARKAGYKVLFEPKSKVVHVHKMGSIKKHYKDSVILSYAMRNQFTFIWKNITDLNLILSHLFFLPYHFLKAVLQRNGVFLKGFMLALVRLPAIINHRRIQQKTYVHSDKELLKEILE